MNLSARLDRFRADNPYDIGTQAKRLLASNDQELIRYAVELGLNLARQRQRHEDRQYMKDTGFAPDKERIVFKPGRVTGAVTPIVKHSRKTENAARQFLLDTWRINGEQPLGDATNANLGDAIKREFASINGHHKNVEFYQGLGKRLTGTEKVRNHWSEGDVRKEIERVYGELRTTEAA